MVGNTVVSIQERVRIDVIAGNEEPYDSRSKMHLTTTTRRHPAWTVVPESRSLCREILVEKGTIDRRTNSYELTRQDQQEIEARNEWDTYLEFYTYSGRNWNSTE
jgi:PadR family transcriptional regulator PadR